MEVKLEKWHKCQIDKEVLKDLSKKSDLKGLQHVSVFFGLLLVHWKPLQQQFYRAFQSLLLKRSLYVFYMDLVFRCFFF